MLFIFIWDSLFEASRQCFLPDRVATYSRGDRCWPHESSLASCQALAHCRCLKTPLAWTTGSLGSVEETDLTVPKIQLVGGVNPSQNPNKNESHRRIFIIWAKSTWQPLLVPAIHTVSRKPHRFMELDSSPPISLAGSNIALAGKKQIPPRSITSPISQAPSTPHHPGACPARAKAKPPTRWFGRSFVKRKIGFLTKVKWSLEPVNWGFGMVNGQMGHRNGKTVSRNLGMVDFAFWCFLYFHRGRQSQPGLRLVSLWNYMLKFRLLDPSTPRATAAPPRSHRRHRRLYNALRSCTRPAKMPRYATICHDMPRCSHFGSSRACNK